VKSKVRHIKSAGLVAESVLTEAKIWSADLVHLKGFGFLLWRSDEGTDVGPRAA